MNEPVEQKIRHCPRLGMAINFGYCLKCEENKTPCWKILDCWWEEFDVTAWIGGYLGPDVVEALAQARPKPKIVGILEMIEQARKNINKNNET
jgi:hypothetical protein